MIICPECVGYEHCLEMGYADAEHCVNFEKKVEYIPEEMYFLHDDGSGLAYGQLAPEEWESRTCQITNCDKIVLKDKSLNFEFEIPRDHIDYFDEIIVNGIKFKKVEDI